MDNVFTFLYLTFFMPFLLTIPGTLQALTPFALLYAFPILVLIITAIIFRRSHSGWAAVLSGAALIGTWLSFITLYASVFLSRSAVGFPFASLKGGSFMYGSDTVPVEMWLGTFANEYVWITIAVLISSFLIRKKKINVQKIVQPIMMLWTTLLSVIAVLMYIGMCAFLFD